MERVTKRKGGALLNIGRVCIGLSPMWLLVLLLMLAGSCTEMEVEEGKTPPHALREVETGFKLNVEANRNPVTRSLTFTADGTIESDTLSVEVADTVKTKAADPLGDESLIANLWIGQYNAETGERLSGQYISSVNGNEVVLKLRQNGTTRSHVYFIANAGNLGEAAAAAVATESQLNAHVMPYISSEIGLPENGLCKMVGKWEGVVEESAVANVVLTRLLAKITLIYSIGGEGFSFLPMSVTLNSVPQSSQVGILSDQLPGTSYTTYVGIADRSEATMYWYLPENMAGTVTGDDAVDDEKQKTGRGVSNATYIEMTGDAIQNGVVYKNVTYRLYPGPGMNSYNIERNTHHTVNVTLIGIDLSDERITVGEISPIVVPGRMNAEKGSEIATQITARPGQAWAFTMPGWLSALMDGSRRIAANEPITHQGPVNLLFRAETANPRAEERSVSIPAGYTVDGVGQVIPIVQNGSTLKKGNTVSLGNRVNSEGESSFTATKGLQWQATLDGGSWFTWAATNPGTSGIEASGRAQNLKVRATSTNPLAQARTGRITVRAGESVNNAGYSGLRQVIDVSQAPSVVAGCPEVFLAEAVAASNRSWFSAPSGLSWVAQVTSGSWISLTGATSGSTTTGAAQWISFNVPVNLLSFSRTETITVRAGDRTNGPTGVIRVNQAGSSFSLSGTAINLHSVQTQGSITVTGTRGLPWTLTRISGDLNIVPAGGTTAIASGDPQVLAFNVPPNTGIARSATFRVAVTGGNHSHQLTVAQAAVTREYDLVIDNTVYQEYRRWVTNPGHSIKVFPAFDFDGVTDWKGIWATSQTDEGVLSIGGSYKIQVSRRDPIKNLVPIPTYEAAQSYCRDLVEDGYSDWRMPSFLELVATGMYGNVLRTKPYFEELPWELHLSCSVFNRNPSIRIGSHYANNNCLFITTLGVPDDRFTVRCVRDTR